MSLKHTIELYQRRVEVALDHHLPRPEVHPSRLHEAMRYATFNGGKRIRPLLVYLTGEALGLDATLLDAPACAVELIHCYSLVHDDLPAMDDDDLRRGKPTCHRAYDEATAILAGDALQAHAFQILAQDNKMIQDPAVRLRMIAQLAQASGSRGMCGGQAIDLGAVGRQLDLAELEDMHIHKTGALIRASVLLGAMSKADIDPDLLHRLDHFAKCIGLMFQIQDDILDVESDTATLGKQQGADQARNKPTYPALVGLTEAKQMAHELFSQAIASLEPLNEHAESLHWLADYIITRQH